MNFVVSVSGELVDALAQLRRKSMRSAISPLCYTFQFSLAAKKKRKEIVILPLQIQKIPAGKNQELFLVPLPKT